MTPVKIEWYDGLENCMSIAESEDAVLAEFFTVREWGIVKAFYSAVVDESDCHLAESGFEFSGAKVLLYNTFGETTIERLDFFALVNRLYDVLIEGANEEHHSVRYETWWQDFIDAFFLLQERCKIEALHREEEIVTMTIQG